VSPDTQRGATRTAAKGIRVAIVAVVVEGVRRRDPASVINGVLALGATRLPELVEELYAVEFRPWQRLYADFAMLAHAVGMLGPYDDVWWWDHLTHTLSATLLGGLVFVDARRRGRDPRGRVLAVIVAAGGLWELLEYVIHSLSPRFGLEPVLVSYGRTDTVLDLLFNLVGAVLTLALGDHLLANFVDQSD
jgi:VanZ family protein